MDMGLEAMSEEEEPPRGGKGLKITSSEIRDEWRKLSERLS